MTKTALRALTVVALSAAVALTTAAPAFADDSASPACSPEQTTSTPECPNPWPDSTNVTVCMTQPELCEPEAQPVPVPVAAPAAAPAATTTADRGSAPAARDAERVPAAGAVSTASPAAATTPAAPAAPQAGVPSWVIMDKVLEILRGLVRSLTGQPDVG